MKSKRNNKNSNNRKKNNNNNNNSNNNNKNKKLTNRDKSNNDNTTTSSSTAVDDSIIKNYNNDLWNFVNDAGPGCYIARRQRYNNRENNYNNNNDNNNTTKKNRLPSIEWMIDWEDIDPYDYIESIEEIETFPDIAINYDDRKQLWTLSLCNIRATDYVVAYITVYETILYDRTNQSLLQGSTVDNENKNTPCTTLIVLCPPCTFAHLCYLRLPSPSYEDDTTPLQQLQLDSDVQVWNQHPNPNDTHSFTIGFPLLCTTTTTSDTNSGDGNDDKNDNPDDSKNILETTTTSFLCTQGVGGQLTHFFAGNLHAIDFRCPVGTPLVAVGNGTVIDVKTTNTTLSGIAVSNLFNWNSILLKINTTTTTTGTGSSTSDDTKQHEQTEAIPTTEEISLNRRLDAENNTDQSIYYLKDAIGGPLYVEYVHIATSTVQIGDTVVEGQIIGTSGSIGFSPEPHLHFAAYRSDEPTAPTCRVYFHSNKFDRDDDVLFVPTAGNWYNNNGLVDRS